MTITLQKLRWLAIALPLVCAVSGCCCQAFPLPGESECPTDARRLYCGAGEEAVRRCPCGPDQQFYGLKPTEWRTWPEGWNYGGMNCPMPAEAVIEVPVHGESPVDFSNPFRSDADQRDEAEELPLDVNEPATKPAPAPPKPTQEEESTAPVPKQQAPKQQSPILPPVTPDDISLPTFIPEEEERATSPTLPAKPLPIPPQEGPAPAPPEQPPPGQSTPPAAAPAEPAKPEAKQSKTLPTGKNESSVATASAVEAETAAAQQAPRRPAKLECSPDLPGRVSDHLSNNLSN